MLPLSERPTKAWSTNGEATLLGLRAMLTENSNATAAAANAIQRKGGNSEWSVDRIGTTMVSSALNAARIRARKFGGASIVFRECKRFESFTTTTVSDLPICCLIGRLSYPVLMWLGILNPLYLTAHSPTWFP